MSSSFISRVLDTETREASLFIEDIVIGAYKKKWVESGTPIYSFVMQHQNCTSSYEDILEQIKSKGFESLYVSNFFSDQGLKNISALICSKYDNEKTPDAVGFISFQETKQEGETCFVVSCKISSTDESVPLHFHTFFASKKRAPKVKTGSIYMISQEPDGLSTRYIGTDFIPLEKGNYTKECLELYEKVIKEFNKPNPNGGIFIMNSQPGLGKTFIIRSLLGEIHNSIFVYLPPSLTSSLVGPSLVSCLLNLSEQETAKSITLILEDADEVLAPRAADNMSSISTLLNLTDGILGKILNLRIIATTNTNEKKFDAAIMRPGRLCAHMKLPTLDAEHCQEIYKRITGNEIKLNKNYTLAEVYGMANNSGVEVATVSNFENKTGF